MQRYNNKKTENENPRFLPKKKNPHNRENLQPNTQTLSKNN